MGKKGKKNRSICLKGCVNLPGHEAQKKAVLSHFMQGIPCSGVFMERATLEHVVLSVFEAGVLCGWSNRN